MDNSWSSDSEERRRRPRRVVNRNEVPDQQDLDSSVEPQSDRVVGSPNRMPSPRQDTPKNAILSATLRLESQPESSSASSFARRNENVPQYTTPSSQSREAQLAARETAPIWSGRLRPEFDLGGRLRAMGFDDKANSYQTAQPLFTNSSMQRTPPSMLSNATLRAASSPRVSPVSQSFNRSLPPPALDFERNRSPRIQAPFFDDRQSRTPPSGPSREAMMAAAMAPRRNRSQPGDRSELQDVSRALDFGDDVSPAPQVLNNNWSPRTPPNGLSREAMMAAATSPRRTARSQPYDRSPLQQVAQCLDFGNDANIAATSPQMRNNNLSPRTPPNDWSRETQMATAVAPRRTDRSQPYDREELREVAGILDFEDVAPAPHYSEPQAPSLRPDKRASSPSQSRSITDQNRAARMEILRMMVNPKSIPRNALVPRHLLVAPPAIERVREPPAPSANAPLPLPRSPPVAGAQGWRDEQQTDQDASFLRDAQPGYLQRLRGQSFAPPPSQIRNVRPYLVPNEPLNYRYNPEMWVITQILQVNERQLPVDVGAPPAPIPGPIRPPGPPGPSGSPRSPRSPRSPGSPGSPGSPILPRTAGREQ